MSRDETEDVRRKQRSWGNRERMWSRPRRRRWPWRWEKGLEGKVREVEGTLAWWAPFSNGSKDTY